MDVRYDETTKDLPPEQLHALFQTVGWSDGSETAEMIRNYNFPFLHSTLVVSAWRNDLLVGAVRVLSDTLFRSIIYDLLVLPALQSRGIGMELLRRCIAHFPDSEWLVQTTEPMAEYYEKNGFQVNRDVFLTIPCKLFTLPE